MTLSGVAAKEFFFEVGKGETHLLHKDKEMIDEVAGFVGEAVAVAVDSLDH